MDALRLGPLLLPWGPLILVLGYTVAVFVAGAERHAGRGNPEPALLPLLVLGLVAARAAFVLQHAADYPSALSMLDIRDRGFNPWAGWAAGLFGVMAWAWRRPMLRRSLPTSVATGAAVMLAALGLLQLAQPPRTPLPAITLPKLGGGDVAMQSLQGQPLVLNLWATWCPPCRRELPVLVAAAKQAQGARILLVDEGESAAQVAAFLRQENLNPPEVLLDTDKALMAHYQAPGYPTTLFIAADGRMRRMHVGELSAATLAQGVAALRDDAAP